MTNWHELDPDIMRETLDIFPPDARQIVVLACQGFTLGQIAYRTCRSMQDVQRVLRVCRQRLAVLAGER